jgi:hypothetical protein
MEWWSSGVLEIPILQHSNTPSVVSVLRPLFFESSDVGYIGNEELRFVCFLTFNQWVRA